MAVKDHGVAAKRRSQLNRPAVSSETGFQDPEAFGRHGRRSRHVKHELIRCYLNGWYPKLGAWARRVLYVDTHAGRGRYESGDPGSPVLALQTLLRHSYREKLLNASE